jgi:hypothetical protein
VPAHLWAGPHVYDQARRASRFTSLATAWRTVMNGLDAVVGPDPRTALPVLSALLGCVVLLAVRGCRLRSVAAVPAGSGALRNTVDRTMGPEPGPETPSAALRAASAQIFLALAVTYLLVSPYVLPWYDALGWAPLAIVAGGFGLDGALLLRSTTLALAYTPGLVGGSSRAEVLMLHFRTWVAPLITFGVLVWVLVRGLRPGWRELGRAVRARPSGRRPISSG